MDYTHILQNSQKSKEPNVNGVWATAHFRKNFERRVGHSNISKLEGTMNFGDLLVGSRPADLRRAKKKFKTLGTCDKINPLHSRRVGHSTFSFS